MRIFSFIWLPSSPSEAEDRLLTLQIFFKSFLISGDESRNSFINFELSINTKMEQYVCLKKTPEVEKLSSSLGYTTTFYEGDDFAFINGKSPAQINAQIQKNKGKKLIYIASSEEMLRYVLSKTQILLIMGVEKIHHHDSLHHPRGGIDDVTCTIAKDQEKTFVFSFADILTSSSRASLLTRIRFNISLCRWYKVKTLFSTFAKTKEEIRSAKDLASFWQVLNKH